MVRASISPVTDVQSNNNFIALRETVNGQMDVDNMKIQVIEGTTSDTPDTKNLIRHSLSPAPHAWFPLVGDVYVEELNGTYADVRSTKRNVAFKIILVSGRQLVNASITPASNYVNTTGVISSTLMSAGGVIPTEYYTGQTGLTQAIQTVVVGSNLYWTQVDSSGGATDEQIHKMDLTTGVHTSLDPTGSLQYGAMYYNPLDGFLYVAETNGGTSPYSVLKIDLATFTVNTTISCTTGTPFASASLAVLYVDPIHNIILGGRTGTGRGLISKFTSAGALVTTITNATGSTDANAGFKSLVDDGTNYYVVSTDGAPASENAFITKISHGTTYAGFSAASVITITSSVGTRGQASTLVNGKIYIPFSATAEVFASTADSTYLDFLLILNTADDSFTKVPFPILDGTASNQETNTVTKSILHYNNKIYWVSTDSSTTTLYSYDLTTADVLYGSMFFSHPANSTAQGLAINNILFADGDGYPMILRLGNSNGSHTHNTCWCKPILE